MALISSQAGIKVSVFEYEHSPESYRPREWTMGAHWGLPLMESLLSDHTRKNLVEGAYVDPTLDWTAPQNNTIKVFDGPSGQIMKEVAVPGKLVRMSRRKLRGFLASEIDVEVCYQVTWV